MYWQEGDQCYFEFRVWTIKEVTAGRVTTLSRCGVLGGYDLQVYPINDATTKLAEWFHARYDQLHSACPSLHFGHIQQWLNQRFDECYRALLAEESYDRILTYVDECIERIKEVHQAKVDGIGLFEAPRT